MMRTPARRFTGGATAVLAGTLLFQSDTQPTLASGAPQITAPSTLSVLIGDDDGFGGTQGPKSTPGQAYFNFSSPGIPGGVYADAAGLDVTTLSPYTGYAFQLTFSYDASAFTSLTAATVTVQSGSLARRSDGSGFGFATVTADDGSGAVGLGDFLTTSTGTAASALEESVKAHVFNVLSLVHTSGPATLTVTIDGRDLPNPFDQFALDYARLDIEGTTGSGFELTGLTLKSSVTPGCKAVSGTLALSGPAPAGGVVVSLHDTLASASVPSTVKIPEGKSSKAFKVATQPVSVAESGVVSATYGATTLDAPLTVRPISVQSISLTPNPAPGGVPVSGVVTLECTATLGPIVVDLESSRPTAANPTTSSVTVNMGSKSAPFSVLTFGVSAKTKVKILTTANDLAKSKALTITP